MVDVFTKEKRSEVMAKIRGHGNKSTEWRLRSILIASGIKGWRLRAKDLPGKPDFVFDDIKLAVFVDGCFWHGCRRCRSLPKTNNDFWSQKISLNRRRDRKINLQLRNAGWIVMRFWEHQLKSESHRCIRRIIKSMDQAIGLIS
jgi:DNA mismatch endonuclease (patch repair protein)